MNKIKLLVMLVVGLGLVVIGCKSQSYGSSGLKSQNMAVSDLTIEDGDCFAWKFYLLTDIYSTVHRGATRNVNNMRRKYLDHSTYSGPPAVDMYKILPPETAKKIIDAIIEKEGGHCSREVLYDITHCSYYFEPVDRGSGGLGGTVHTVGVYAKINFDYFSKVTGFSINKQLVSDYNNFINEHISQSPQTIAQKGLVYCVDDCVQNVFLSSYNNSFGRCMFEKHREYLKGQVTFDFGDYFYWGKNDYDPKLSIPSMESFIKESDEVAERYREKTGSP